MESYESVISELEEVKANFNQQWDDDTKNRFYGKYVSDYSGKIDRYVSQVKELGTFLEIRKNEMKSLVNSVK